MFNSSKVRLCDNAHIAAFDGVEKWCACETRETTISEYIKLHYQRGTYLN